MVQKTHGNGVETRYFWNVKMADGKRIEYRSRLSTPAAVRAQLRKMGNKVTGCSPTKA